MLFALVFVLVFLILWLAFFAVGPLLEKLLARAAHFTTKFRYRDYLPVAVVLAIGIAATAFAGDAFMDIAEELHANTERLQVIDRETHAWARTAYTSGATRFFTTMTLIGTPVGLGILLAIVGVILLLRGRWRWAMYLAVTAGIGGLLNLLLKSWFARARPDLAEALRHATGYSFPSGHAMGSTICFLALSYVAFRVLHRWRDRAAALAFACTMILAIASSRIYLGVHWISDIGGGIAAGLIWFAASTVAYETFRRIRMIRALRAKAAAKE